MIIADTMVWADFIARGDQRLADLLARETTLMHPMVRGEISLGNLRNCAEILADLDAIPRATVAEHEEVLGLIESASLAGAGIGFVDSHLLASTMLIPNGVLWTRDRRLLAVAERLGIAFPAA